MDSLSYFINHLIKPPLFFLLIITIGILGLPSGIVLLHPDPQPPHQPPINQISAYYKTEKHTRVPAPPPHLISMGWLVGEDSKSQLINYDQLQVVSPLFATIDGSNHIKLDSSSSSIATLHNEGKTVWGRVTLDTQSDSATHQFLEGTKGWGQLINKLTTDAQKEHLDGLNIDIEQIQAADRNAFSYFIMNLSKAAKHKHLTLSIDLQPESSDDSSSLSFYNHQLGKYSDYLIFMGYDEHWSSDSTPGPVTSLQWLEDNVKQLIQTGIPSKKLLLGLPSYSRIWQVNQNGQTLNSQALSNEYVDTYLQNNKLDETWEPSQAVYYTSYTNHGDTYKVWLTNNRSLMDYLNLIDKYHLGGMGVWNLNIISSENWNQLVDQFNKNHPKKPF